MSLLSLPAAAASLSCIVATPTHTPTSLVTAMSTASSSASAVIKQKKPNTKAWREEPCLYFLAHVKCALNTGLSRGYYIGPIKATVEKHSLSRDQTCLQFKNYKTVTFGLLEVKLMFGCKSL